MNIWIDLNEFRINMKYYFLFFYQTKIFFIFSFSFRVIGKLLTIGKLGIVKFTKAKKFCFKKMKLYL